MLTRAQLNKAVNDRLKAEFPAIPIQSSDVEEGFQRPSFFVQIETNRTEDFHRYVFREMTCRILYFPRDRHLMKEEAYDVQDRLEKLFGLNIGVNGRTLTINGAETVVVDKVVHYDFDFNFYDEPADSSGDVGEPMEELNYGG